MILQRKCNAARGRSGDTFNVKIRLVIGGAVCHREGRCVIGGVHYGELAKREGGYRGNK